jgi:hypothetical protein
MARTVIMPHLIRLLKGLSELALRIKSACHVMMSDIIILPLKKLANRRRS